MVNDLFKKGLNALVSKQTNIFSAAFFIILTTIFSQILGLLKYRLLVSIFGASSDLGVFFASFRIPDLLFQVLIGGALSSAFIPVFSEYLSKGKKEGAYSMTSSFITLSVSFFIAISLIVSVFSFQFSSLIAPGFSPKELELMSNLQRVLLFTQIFFILGTIITAVLQSFQHFLIPGIASAMYNLGIIIGLVIFTPIFGIYGATFGVFLGSILFFIVQLFMLKKVGFKFHFSLSVKNGVLKIINLMIPRIFTLVIAQVAITANVFFASFISARSLVIFDLAQTLVFGPVILFGQSIAQASFPSLSLKKEEKSEFLYIFSSSFNQILYLTLPISAILIVLRIPVVRLFFGASRFDWDATVATGMTLAFFSLSIFAQALIYLLSRTFFALKDTKTPLFVTLFSVFINITLAYYFILSLRLPIYYLALAFSIANIIAFFSLMFFLDKKINLPKVEMAAVAGKIILVTLIMGISLYVPIKLLDKLVFDTTRTINLLILTGIASGFGFLSYVLFTWLLNIKEAYYIIAVFKKFGNRNKILKQVNEVFDTGSKLNP